MNELLKNVLSTMKHMGMQYPHIRTIIQHNNIIMVIQHKHIMIHRTASEGMARTELFKQHHEDNNHNGVFE